MGDLIEEEILITLYQRWLINKLKEHSRSRRESSLPPKSYRLRKLQPALDTTKKLDSVSYSQPALQGRSKRKGPCTACWLALWKRASITVDSCTLCLGFKTPIEASEGAYIDKKCPFTGNVSIRGRIFK